MTSEEKVGKLINLFRSLDSADDYEWSKIDRQYEKSKDSIIDELEVLKILKDKLDNNTLFRVFPYEIASKIETFLKSNNKVKKWLSEVKE